MIQVPTFISYDDWKNAFSEEKIELKAYVDCPECKGSGETYCCHCDREGECPSCGGYGRVLATDIDDWEEVATREMYRKEVWKDLIDWCTFTRTDFLALAGAIIKSGKRSILSPR